MSDFFKLNPAGYQSTFDYMFHVGTNLPSHAAYESILTHYLFTRCIGTDLPSMLMTASWHIICSLGALTQISLPCSWLHLDTLSVHWVYWHRHPFHAYDSILTHYLFTGCIGTDIPSMLMTPSWHIICSLGVLAQTSLSCSWLHLDTLSVHWVYWHRPPFHAHDSILTHYLFTGCIGTDLLSMLMTPSWHIICSLGVLAQTSFPCLWLPSKVTCSRGSLIIIVSFFATCSAVQVRLPGGLQLKSLQSFMRRIKERFSWGW